MGKGLFGVAQIKKRPGSHPGAHQLNQVNLMSILSQGTG
jgi:hypothetical protein